MLAAPGKVDHLIATAVADPVVNSLVDPLVNDVQESAVCAPIGRQMYRMLPSAV